MYAGRARALKGLALPRSSHSGEIAVVGSLHLHSMLVVAPVLFAHCRSSRNRTSATPLPNICHPLPLADAPVVVVHTLRYA